MLAKILTNGFFSAELRTNVLARLQHKTTQTNLRNSCTKLHLRILCHAGAAIRAPLPCTTTDPRTKIECYLLPSCAQELPRSSDAAWTIREVSSESQNNAGRKHTEGISAALLARTPGNSSSPRMLRQRGDHHHDNIHPFRCDEQKSITTMPEALSVDFSGKSSNRTSSTTLSSDESCAGHVVEYSDLAIHSPTRGPKVQRNLEAHSNAQWRHMSSRYFGISLNIHRGARHDVKPSRHTDEVHAKELK